MGESHCQRTGPSHMRDPRNEIIDVTPDDPNKVKKTDDGGLLGGVVGGLKKFFGQDEASLAKKKQEAELDKALDQAFAGTGLLGGMMKNMVKGVGGMVLEG